MNDTIEIVEEHDDDEMATDVEREEVDNDTPFEDISRPWNPENIRVSTKTFSIRNVLDLIDEDSLDLAPDFQRNKVWKMKQKSQLIESVLLQIPLPTFYFAEDRDGTMRVVDGLQRLSTIHAFVRGGGDRAFPLQGVEYIADVEGQDFDDLPAPWKRRIYNTQIVAHVIDPTTPTAVKYDVFRRINTGGTPLTSQEIRHCMSDKRSRDFLKRNAESPVFVKATGGALARGNRMVNREVVLRYVAFSLMHDIADYRTAGPMEDLLWRTTEQLDDPSVISDARLAELEKGLERGLRLSSDVFGEHAFRKWPRGTSRRHPFNRALFETWTCCLATRDADAVRARRDRIADEARGLMSNNYDYLSAVTSSTGDPRRVELRFTAVERLLDTVLA